MNTSSMKRVGRGAVATIHPGQMPLQIVRAYFPNIRANPTAMAGAVASKTNHGDTKNTEKTNLRAFVSPWFVIRPS
jgi:hypothetical protein